MAASWYRIDAPSQESLSRLARNFRKGGSGVKRTPTGELWVMIAGDHGTVLSGKLDFGAHFAKDVMNGEQFERYMEKMQEEKSSTSASLAMVNDPDDLPITARITSLSNEAFAIAEELEQLAKRFGKVQDAVSSMKLLEAALKKIQKED